MQAFAGSWCCRTQDNYLPHDIMGCRLFQDSWRRFWTVWPSSWDVSCSLFVFCLYGLDLHIFGRVSEAYCVQVGPLVLKLRNKCTVGHVACKSMLLPLRFSVIITVFGLLHAIVQVNFTQTLISYT